MRRRLGSGVAADRGVRPRKIGGADGALGVLSNGALGTWAAYPEMQMQRH